MLTEAMAQQTLAPEALSAARLATVLLLGLLAWLLPIVLRRVAPRQPFAPMFLLAPVQARAERSRRTRNVLVRALRAIAAAGLVLVVWPPSEFTVAPAQSDDAPRLVIDASASMGWSGDGSTPFDEAVALAERFAAQDPETRILLAGASPRWIQASGLAEARPCAGRSSLDAAFALVRNAPRAVLLTDLRFGPGVSIPDHVEIVRVGPSGLLANAAVVALEADGPDLLASVLWTGEAARPITAELRLPDGSTRQRSVFAVSDATTPVRFERVLTPRGGVFEVRLLDAGDRLTADDRAAAVAPRVNASLTPLREDATPREVERRVRVMAAVRAMGLEAGSERGVRLGGPWDSREVADVRLGDGDSASLALRDDDWAAPTLVLRLAEALRKARPLRSTRAGQPARVRLPVNASGPLAASPPGALLRIPPMQPDTVLIEPTPERVKASVLAGGEPVARAAWTPDPVEARLEERTDLPLLASIDAIPAISGLRDDADDPIRVPGPMIWALIAAAALCLEPLARRGAS